MTKKGFTLAELLVAIMIVAMLAAMAVPMYEKAIEKSRLGEMRTVLAQIQASKERVLDSMEKASYTNGLFGFAHLDLSMTCQSGGTDTDNFCQTKDFKYTISPTGTTPVAGVDVINGVCAARCGGDNNNTAFLYIGRTYVTDTSKSTIYCYGSKCSEYGFTQANPGSKWCSC